MTVQKNRQLPLGFIRSGYIHAVWMGAPLGRLSRARNRLGDAPPLRDEASLGGLPGLCLGDALQVWFSSETAEFCALVLHTCAANNVPGAIANLEASGLWQQPYVAQLMRFSGLKWVSHRFLFES